MLRKNRLISLMMCCLMLTQILWGCGKPATTQPGQGTSVSTTPAATSELPSNICDHVALGSILVQVRCWEWSNMDGFTTKCDPTLKGVQVRHRNVEVYQRYNYGDVKREQKVLIFNFHVWEHPTRPGCYGAFESKTGICVATKCDRNPDDAFKELFFLMVPVLAAKVTADEVAMIHDQVQLNQNTIALVLLAAAALALLPAEVPTSILGLGVTLLSRLGLSTQAAGAFTAILVALQSVGSLGPPNTPPVANAGGPYNGKVNTSIQFIGSATDRENNSIVQWEWSVVEAGINLQPIQKPTWIPNTAGLYHVTLKVKDSGGAWSTLSQTTATITNNALGVNYPPTITVNCRTAWLITAGTIITMVWSTADANADAVQVAIDWADGTPIEWSSGTRADHVFKNTGSYTMRFTAYDGKAWSPTSTCVVGVTGGTTNRPPVARLTCPGSGIVGRPLTVTPSYEDPDGDAMQYGAFDWNDGSPIQFLYTTASTDHTYARPGTFTIRWTVRDARWNWSPTATCQVIVESVPQSTPVSLPSPVMLSVRVGQALSYQFQATGGTPGYGIVYAVVTGATPPGTNLNAQGLFFGPVNVAGAWTFVVEARDMGNPANSARATVDIMANFGSGNLHITTRPVAGDINVDGILRGHGEVVVSVEAGTHTLTFGDVTDYSNPGTHAVTVADGQTLDFVATYVPIPGRYVSIISYPPPTPWRVGRSNNQANVETSQGAYAPDHWTIVSGSLPPGLHLQSEFSGYVVGTPTQAGTWSFRLHVRDSSPPPLTPLSDEVTLTITVQP